MRCLLKSVFGKLEGWVNVEGEVKNVKELCRRGSHGNEPWGLFCNQTDGSYLGNEDAVFCQSCCQI